MTLEERFWAKVHPEPNTGCWLWDGNIRENGYGRAWDSERQLPILAHRLAWILARGPIPDGLLVGHRCHLRQCVNPAHLFVGTRRESMDDTFLKGNDRRSHGSAHPDAILDDAKVTEARRLWSEGVRIAQLARDFGVKVETMASVVHGRTWKHIPMTERRKGKEIPEETSAPSPG